MQTVADELRNYKSRIEEQKKLILSSVHELKTAELPNPNIPIRARQLMEGNRETYSSYAQRLAEHIVLPETYEQLEFFIAQFDNDLKDMLKSTQRSFFVMQEFLANETKEVAANINGMEKIVNTLREFVREEGFHSFDKISSELVGLKDGKNSRKEIDNKIIELNNLIADEEKNKANAAEQILKIKESDEFKKYLEAEQQKAKLDDQIKILDSAVLPIFSHVENPLRKYERVTEEEKDAELSRLYSQNPIENLMKDDSFAIIGILENIKKAIEENKIEIKDEKKQKALEAIPKLTKDFLNDFKTKRKVLMVQLNTLADECKKHSQEENIANQVNAQKISNTKITDLQNRIADIKLTREKIDILSHTTKITELVQDVDNVSIELITD